jgi:hypothetical protein
MYIFDYARLLERPDLGAKRFFCARVADSHHISELTCPFGTSRRFPNVRVESGQSAIPEMLRVTSKTPRRLMRLLAGLQLINPVLLALQLMLCLLTVDHPVDVAIWAR